MREEYRYEMEQLEPRQEALERLYEMTEGGIPMNRTQKLGCRAALLIAACAVLTITAAATVVPGVWETLQAHLGAFAPYAQSVEGALAIDQGVELQVLSALSDDMETRVYFSVRDMDQDRLDEHLTLSGRLTVGTEGEGAPDGKWSSGFQLLSYDPTDRTGLFSASIRYGKDKTPGRLAQLSFTGMTTREAELSGIVSCASVTGEVLKSLPAGEDSRMILKASEIGGMPYTDAVLPGEPVVLAPDQTPIPIEGNEEIWISSMGFAGDGCFHIRLGFAEGVSVCDENGDSWFLCALGQTGKSDEEENAIWERLVPGGVDIIFPLYTAEDLEALQKGTVEFYGDYTRPGLDIEGSWSAEFPLEHCSSAVLDWTGELSGRQVRQVTLSPLSVTMKSSDTGLFSRTTLHVVKKDGTAVAAKPGWGRYSKRDGGTDAYNTWQLEEPVNVEDVASLTLLDGVIPVN